MHKAVPKMLKPWHLWARMFVPQKDFDSALHYFERALRVNPNLAFVWALSALTIRTWGGPSTLQQLERHRDLTPIEPYPALFDNPYAIAYLIARL